MSDLRERYEEREKALAEYAHGASSVVASLRQLFVAIGKLGSDPLELAPLLQDAHVALVRPDVASSSPPRKRKGLPLRAPYEVRAVQLMEALPATVSDLSVVMGVSGESVRRVYYQMKKDPKYAGCIVETKSHDDRGIEVLYLTHADEH